MTTPIWVTEAAEAFWAYVGRSEAFPRDLHVPISLALPVAIVSLPRLHLRSVEGWLQSQGIVCRLDARDRSLRAVLVARRGHGLIFLAGADPADEQRFSLAHELAHYLRDYWIPRQRTVERLGLAALEVLNGDRLPHDGERIDAVLSHVELGYHVHLLDRTSDGAITYGATALAEYSADLLACELLAPVDSVLVNLPALSNPELREYVCRRLINEFGLPPQQAIIHSVHLVPPPKESLIRRLGFVS